MDRSDYKGVVAILLCLLFSACHDDDASRVMETRHTDLFWTSLGDATIERARIEGDRIVDRTVLYNARDGLEAPSAIVTDALNNMIYWTDFSTQQILRAPWDGHGVPEVLYTVPRPGLGPVELALDPVSQYLYWTQPFDDLILRAPARKNGAVDTLFNRGDGVDGAWGIALQFSGQYLYWIEFIDVELHRSTIDGSNAQLLYAGGSGFLRPYGLALQEDAGDLFVLDNPLPGAGLPDRILKGSMDRTQKFELVYDLEDGVENAYNLVVDEPSGALYWHNQLPEGSIYRGTTNGKQVPLKLVDGINIGQGIAIANYTEIRSR